MPCEVMEALREQDGSGTITPAQQHPLTTPNISQRPWKSKLSSWLPGQLQAPLGPPLLLTSHGASQVPPHWPLSPSMSSVLLPQGLCTCHPPAWNVFPSTCSVGPRRSSPSDLCFPPREAITVQLGNFCVDFPLGLELTMTVSSLYFGVLGA